VLTYRGPIRAMRQVTVFRRGFSAVGFSGCAWTITTLLAIPKSRLPWFTSRDVTVLMTLFASTFQVGLTSALHATEYRYVRYVSPDGGYGNVAELEFYARDAARPAETYLSDVAWAGATSGYGPVERDASNGEYLAGDGHRITINGAAYAKGLAAHADSEIRYQIGGGYTRFVADVGLDDEVGGNGSVVFRVFADDVLLYESGVMTNADAARHVDVDVAGRQVLRLVVTDAGDGIAGDHGDWAGARLLRAVAAPVFVSVAPPPTAPDEESGDAMATPVAVAAGIKATPASRVTEPHWVDATVGGPAWVGRAGIGEGPMLVGALSVGQPIAPPASTLVNSYVAKTLAPNRHPKRAGTRFSTIRIKPISPHRAADDSAIFYWRSRAGYSWWMQFGSPSR
jgi:hypothetical protein